MSGINQRTVTTYALDWEKSSLFKGDFLIRLELFFTCIFSSDRSDRNANVKYGLFLRGKLMFVFLNCVVTTCRFTKMPTHQRVLLVL